MSGSASNIVIGPASMTYQRSGGAVTDVGFTKGGVAIRLPRDYHDTEADQVIGVLRKSKIKEQMFVKTTLLESSFAHMSLAWDQAASGTPNTGVLGSPSAAVNEVKLVVVGPGPDGATRTFTLHRCVAIAEAEYAYSRDDESGQEVEFEVIKGDGIVGAGLGLFGTVVDTGTLAITNDSPLTAQVSGTAMDPEIALASSGGTEPVTWEITAGALPAGLSLAEDGTISGTPTQEGVFVFSVEATDALAATGSKEFSITVTEPA